MSLLEKIIVMYVMISYVRKHINEFDGVTIRKYCVLFDDCINVIGKLLK